ncbi:MAG: polyprenyl synthetase family protein, partial [Planctomycetota bacterium]|nr:polyprenyl synthetase family protein [Planctomycetota bacterium]
MATDLSPGSNLDSALETKRKLLEEYLDRHLPPEDREPRTLHQAMRYSVLSGGKRIRPLLTLLVAEAVGGNVEEALPVAAAFECIHAYSLIHDDLPCMDDDDLRRGRATNHKVYGEAMAVLVGDALLTLAFEAIADGGAEAVGTLAAAAGSQGMVGGQVQDLTAEERTPGRDDDLSELQWIHDHKTGALIT